MRLVRRAGNLIRAPRREWPVIAEEDTGIADLYTGYVAIVAAVALTAELIAGVAGGVPVWPALGTALSGYVMALADVAVLGVVASKLAPVFGGVGDPVQAFKLAAYAATPAWLGGVFLLLPVIGRPLTWLCDLYGICLCYLGTGVLMDVPRGRRLGYLAAILVLALVLAMALALLFGAAIGQARMTIVHA